MYRSSLRRKSPFSLHSFTLIELLTVIAIIAILASITLAAANGLMKQAARTRTHDEITGMGTALESYKVDNGAYPAAAFLLGPPTAAYTDLDSSLPGGKYQLSSQALYQALSGKVNYTDPATGAKYYMTFKPGQLGNLNNNTYIKDPFGFSYGYSSGDANVGASQVQYPYSGRGFFDLWSTGGTIGPKSTDTNTWILNWSQ
jgi:prepilin-type N-terminal cleavage/methylation domain-containing protein